MLKWALIAGGALAFRKGLITVTADQNANTAVGAAAGYVAYRILAALV